MGGCKYIWGEVKEIKNDQTAEIKPMFIETTEVIDFDYCVIAAGCNFGPFHKWGQSLWFPTIHEAARPEGDWPHIDERFLEGRRRHILEEYGRIKQLENQNSKVLVVGAGFIGVEWVTELQHFFPKLDLTIIDFLPQCLGPLPAKAAKYCSKYMEKKKIKQHYNTKYDAKSQEFWDKIGLPNKPDKEYVCIGVKASNYFMPKECLSEKGPGGGGWIHFNKKLQVTRKPELGGQVWAKGCAFAVGDCNYGCIGDPSNWELPPIPKISYPGEEQAIHAIKNVEAMARLKEPSEDVMNKKLMDTWWPWGAGMFATSLGPHDACFVAGANEKKGSGWMVNWWIWAALQKEIIESTKIDECKDRPIGKMIWHFVHHTPVNFFGRGPCNPYGFGFCCKCCEAPCCCCEC